jgi:hypothetical protein
MLKSDLDSYGNSIYSIQVGLNPSRIARVHVASPIKIVNSVSDEPVSSWWKITFDGLLPSILKINPPCTKQLMMSLNQGASMYEPITEPFYIEVLPND